MQVQVLPHTRIYSITFTFCTFVTITLSLPAVKSGDFSFLVSDIIYYYICRAIKNNSMNKIEIFRDERFGEVRVAGTSENPLFCLADICRILEIKNVSDCKSRLKQDGVVLTYITDSLGREQQTSFVNEQNLYRLIMRSDKQQAEPFQDWVCGEVLPTIRKTGKYSIIDKSLKHSRKHCALQRNSRNR